MFPDPDGAPGPGWSAGGAFALPLSSNVSLSLNYDHMYLDTPGTMRSVNPLTAQLELGTPYQRRISPRVGVGAGLYDIKSRNSIVINPLGGFDTIRTRHRGIPFGMNFGGGVSIPLWARTLFDVDLRYHQTMGSSSLVMGTVGAGLTYRLGGVEDGTWASARARDGRIADR